MTGSGNDNWKEKRKTGVGAWGPLFLYEEEKIDTGNTLGTNVLLLFHICKGL